MKPSILLTLVLIFLLSCSNSNDIETGEVKTFKILRGAFKELNSNAINIDVRKIFTRQQIDTANIPILLIELENGRNATLTQYPGEGVGVTWLSRDGATLTFINGVLIASRGMGDDIMGGTSLMPHWSEIRKEESYSKSLTYLKMDNQIKVKQFLCMIKIKEQSEKIEIFDQIFETSVLNEKCYGQSQAIENIYYIDTNHIVRRSKQYHGETIGYILTERLDK